MPPWVDCPPRVCEGCGRTYHRLAKNDPGAFRRRKFCSAACDLAHRTHRVDDHSGRAIARKLYPLEPCEVCGFFEGGQGRVQRHHIDSNRQNNARSNIAFLCVLHHNAAHRASDGRVGGGPRPRIVKMKHDHAVAEARLALGLMHAGLTLRESAVLLGRHYSSVFRWLRKYSDELDTLPSQKGTP